MPQNLSKSIENKRVKDVYIVANWEQKSVAILGWATSHSPNQICMNKITSSCYSFQLPLQLLKIDDFEKICKICIEDGDFIGF